MKFKKALTALFVLFGNELLAEPKFYPVSQMSISSKYGIRRHPISGKLRHHAGIDIQAKKGEPVRAISKGVVVDTGKNGTYGEYVAVYHKGGYTSFYAHLSRNLVVLGSVIEEGTVIGEVGSTGISTGPHLHFEIRVNGKDIDPLNIFNEKGRYG